jgi:hypothetical protein
MQQGWWQWCGLSFVCVRQAGLLMAGGEMHTAYRDEVLCLQVCVLTGWLLGKECCAEAGSLVL